MIKLTQTNINIPVTTYNPSSINNTRKYTFINHVYKDKNTKLLDRVDSIISNVILTNNRVDIYA